MTTLIEVRRLILQAMRSNVSPSLIAALALTTRELAKAGVQSLGNVGRTVWVWGDAGKGIIINVTYGPETLFDIYIPRRNLTFCDLKPKDFVYDDR